MKTLILTTCSFLVLSLLVISKERFAAASSSREINRTECNHVVSGDSTLGYDFIVPREVSYLYGRPFELLAKARIEFKDQKYSDSARDIYAASELMKVQAVGNLKGSHLLDVANNLEVISQKVSERKLKTPDALDTELTEAAREAAEHHHLHAAELWAHRLARGVGADLLAAAQGTEKALEWSGQTMTESGERVVLETEKLSEKLVAGGKWSDEEVSKGIASIGSEISSLEKKTEPNKTAK